MIMMNIRIAIAALKSARVRTTLTMLGIIVGVASVTLIMALGEGIKREVTSEVSKLGGNLVQVRPGVIADGNRPSLGLNLLGSTAPSTLNENDLETTQQTPGVSQAAPLMIVTGGASYEGTTLSNPFILATTSDLTHIMDFRMYQGEFFNSQIQTRGAVLGRDIANKLLGTDNQIGNKVKIRNQDFTVIGIVDNDSGASALGGLAPDFANAIFIPFDAGKEAYQGSAQLQEIEVKLADGQQADQVAGAIENGILQNHRQVKDFSVLTHKQALEATGSIVKNLTTFTAAIAAISLLVGGIGVMNIMLVSVTERTREIGIRKSIGATNGHILSQFLIEAMVISIGGGLIGIAVAFGVGGLLSLRLDITPAITPLTIGLAFGVSTAIGILFGIAPALQAARKDPIEALRYE